MVNENEQENPLLSDEPVKPVDDEYLAVSQQAAVRDVVLPTEDVKPKSLTESMDEATDLTDMQFAASNLFPKVVQTRDVMIGRIAPDAFLPLLHIIVTDEIMRANPKEPINVNEAIIKNYVELTIGLDGRGRIDYAELLGSAKEIKKEENLLKGGI
jgi:hypothetical protein